MALPAKREAPGNENGVLEENVVLEVVTTTPPKISPSPSDWEPEAEDMAKHRAPILEKVRLTTEKIARLCGEAVGCVELGCQNLAGKARDVSREVRDRAKQIRNEDPVQAIAVIGASAFVAGLMLRFWRSHKNGR